MAPSALYLILIIVGCFLSIGMAINAFFLKGIYDRLGNVEVVQATIIADSAHIKDELDEQKQINKMLFDEINRIKERV